MSIKFSSEVKSTALFIILLSEVLEATIENELLSWNCIRQHAVFSEPFQSIN